MCNGAPVLLAGNTRDINTIREIFTELPACAFGQVFIEVEHLEDCVPLGALPGFSVNWLVRHDGGRLERPGAKLIRAVKAWASEWVVVDGDFSDFPEVMWVGASEWLEVGEMCQNLMRAYDLHLHHAGLI